ncbi:MAG: cysteine hydrolase [Stigonema ocellatum SAG 48.90 = DSM 106950]|nr:cysteine hydrolase [Stigonema ocellatum SAG 48.90 = DSM 106950]
MKSCIFVIDVQNGFIRESTEHVVKRIESLLNQSIFDFVVFTRFLNTLDSPWVKFLNWQHLISEQERKLADPLQPFAKVVFDKYTYSSVNQETIAFLKRNKIDTVFICGIDTDCCVMETAVDLFEQLIHPYVLTHYSASNGGQESHEAAIRVLSRLIGRNNVIQEPLDKEILLKYLLATQYINN